jgi:hypothetical protein
MSSPVDSSRPLRLFSTWNRKGHSYLGLYFLFFLWLYAFTGLLLNHSWKFADFWPNRRITTFERHVQAPPGGSDFDRARSLASQLGLAGEIDWPAPRPVPPDFAFRITRPGRICQVSLPAGADSARVEITDFNFWGVLRVLHSFTGVRSGETGAQRDWLLTTLWAWSMDALSAGLVLLVASGIVLWLGIPARRRGGLIALASGSLVCAAFVFGLRWFYS